VNRTHTFVEKWPFEGGSREKSQLDEAIIVMRNHEQQINEGSGCAAINRRRRMAIPRTEGQSSPVRSSDEEGACNNPR